MRLVLCMALYLVLTFLSTAFLFWPGWTETLRVTVASAAFIVSIVLPALWFARGTRPAEPPEPPRSATQPGRVRYY